MRILRTICAWYLLGVIGASSVILNGAQVAVSSLVFLPKRIRLALCQRFANPWWALFVFGIESFSGIPIYWYGHQITDSEETSLVIGNHGPGLDFLSGVLLAYQNPNVGTGRFMTLMKASLQYLPTIGWTHYLQGSLFLKRNWNADQKALENKLKEIESKNFPRPFWIGIYPEGTRITPKKKAESQEYSRKNNLPVYEHVLVPRTKGFIFLVQKLPTSIDYLYNVTVGYEGGALHLGDFLLHGKFKCKGIHIHVSRIPFKDLPKEKKEDIEGWLYRDFAAKDQLIEYFQKNDSFPMVSGQANRVNLTSVASLSKLSVLYFLWSFFLTGLLWVATKRPGAVGLSLLLQLCTYFYAKRAISKPKQN